MKIIAIFSAGGPRVSHLKMFAFWHIPISISEFRCVVIVFVNLSLSDLAFVFITIGCSNLNVSSSAREGDYLDNSHSLPHVPDSKAHLKDVSSGLAPIYDHSKQDIMFSQGGSQYPFVHMGPHYSFPFIQPVLGSQLVQYEGAETQACDLSCLTTLFLLLLFCLLCCFCCNKLHFLYMYGYITKSLLCYYFKYLFRSAIVFLSISSIKFNGWSVLFKFTPNSRVI